jgi:hypothetical protein
MDEERKFKQRRIIYTVAAIIGLLGVIGLVVYIVISNSINPWGESIEISNLSRSFPGLPTEKGQYIRAMARTVAIQNGAEAETLKKGALRDGTAESSYDSSTNVNVGSFILDIESAKQSYRVGFDWSSDADNMYLSSDGITIGCLSDEELIYGRFDCSGFPDNATTPVNKIEEILPYATGSYNIYSNGTMADGKFSITVYTTLDLDDSRSFSEQIIATRTAALKYLRDNGFEPAEYTIVYQNDYGYDGN